jgi:hypothetical protein
MAAQDNLSSQQFAVHRGIQSVPPSEWEDWTGEKTGFKLDKTRLGTHWSSDPKVARGFAVEPGSAIIHGEVSTGHVVTDRTEQIHLGADDTQGEYAHEKEVPIRSGSPVKVSSIESIKSNRTRTRRFNPPREMKA